MINVLLVEGPGDQELFLKIAQDLGKTIEVHPPKSRGYVRGNGISNVLAALPFDLENAKSGAISKIGVVIDADHISVNNLGFSARRKEITDILKDYDYDVSVSPPANNNVGEIFLHKNGLNSFGLWIMPDHLNDGSLEDFLAPLITDDDQKDIWAHGLNSLDALDERLIQYNKTCHKSKAELSTWLAMQKPPGIPADLAYKNGLFDKRAANYLAFVEWINRVFC